MNQSLFERAKKVIPAGVNSPVRAFGAVGGTPPFIQEGKGAYLFDVEGRKYLDFIGSWGPMITGHSHPEIQEALSQQIQKGFSFGAVTQLEVEMAELICQNIPQVEMIRMVNSGTEAVMSALRLARGVTGRDKIIKFQGCYHGHCDSMLVKAGSGAMTQGNPDSLGVTQGTAKDTLLADYNHLDSVSGLFQEHKGEIACVIVEPVAANMGVIPPEEGFLQGLRDLCTQEGALLLFDEVITGFRLGFQGAQGYYGVESDLVTYGKIIGGGLPVGAYGGRKEIMEQIAPLGCVYQAGTLSGNPLAMTAGLTCLRYLLTHPDEYDRLEENARFLAEGYGRLGLQVHQVGSLVCPFFTQVPVRDYDTVRTCDTARYARYFAYLLEHQVYLAPSQFEAMFLSTAHRKEELHMVLQLCEAFLQQEQ